MKYFKFKLILLYLNTHFFHFFNILFGKVKIKTQKPIANCFTQILDLNF